MNHLILAVLATFTISLGIILIPASVNAQEKLAVWKCGRCHYVNPIEARQCAKCKTQNPHRFEK